MSLPTPLPDVSEVDVGGTLVRIRGLTREEAMRLTGVATDMPQLERELIALATDTPLDEVAVWYGKVAAAAVQPLVQAIMELSGLTEDAGK